MPLQDPCPICKLPIEECDHSFNEMVDYIEAKESAAWPAQNTTTTTNTIN